MSRYVQALRRENEKKKKEVRKRFLCEAWGRSRNLDLLLSSPTSKGDPSYGWADREKKSNWISLVSLTNLDQPLLEVVRR